MKCVSIEMASFVLFMFVALLSSCNSDHTDPNVQCNMKVNADERCGGSQSGQKVVHFPIEPLIVNAATPVNVAAERPFLPLDGVAYQQFIDNSPGLGLGLGLLGVAYSDKRCDNCDITGSSPDYHNGLISIGEIVPECGRDEDVEYEIPVLCSKSIKKVVYSESETIDDEGSERDLQVIINDAEIEKYANIMIERNLIPNQVEDDDINRRLASGVILLNIGQLNRAIKQLTELINEHSDLLSAYHARGIAYARKGIQFPLNAELAIQDFTKAIDIDPDVAESWERRAEIYTPLGRNKDAMADLNKALSLKITPRPLAHRAMIAFKEENYVQATKDFFASVRLNPTQPETFHFLGLAIYHQGKIGEAIKVFEQTLRQKPELVECIRSLAHAYRELGDYDLALKHFTSALTINPNHVQSLQLRGSLLYHGGKPAEALPDFKACLALEPHNDVCQYMKGLSYAAVGQYFEAIKSNAKLMVQHQIHHHHAIFSNEHTKAMYLREYSRYLHSHLDSPFQDYSIGLDLDPIFKDRWVKSLPFQHFNYVEQPGLSPDIEDVEAISFEELSDDAQKLICKGAMVGPLTQYDADGFLPSKRVHLAMGLAAIDVAQHVKQFWKMPRSFKSVYGKRFTWRDVFNIAIRWRTIVDPEQPIMWLDMMPQTSFQAGYNTHMNLQRGQLFNMRFAKYFDVIFNLTKKMVVQHGLGKPEEKLINAIDKVDNCEQLLKVVKKIKMTTPIGPGFMVSTKIAGYKDSNKRLEGSIFALTGDVSGNVLFSLDTATTKKRTDQYYVELDYIWQSLTEEMKKAHGPIKESELERITNLILSMVYYFYNLMPLSRGSSVVAYTVAIGLVLAIGKEVTGKIPKGKVMDIEAILAGNHETFASLSRGWMNIQPTSLNLSSLPTVSKTFPSLRTMLEALNVGADSCQMCF
ncbi:tetratricopeptide repeat protein 13-like isoform X2 [Antedon mediterranea]|uniref:tetratricopeptide repeat protein 13-like isoform X2 n=1 Tax=Antedon mediterranea TaxID=105859 RepID=UPI003AF86994